MKLNDELRDRDDRYVDGISADELYSILKEEYTFTLIGNSTAIIDRISRNL